MMASESLTSIRDYFIEGAGRLSASLLGILNKVSGQIFALLLLSPEPLSLDDIVEHLQVSKGNVSINIRLLEEYNLVRNVWVKGSRLDYYEAVETVPTKIIREFLEKIRCTITDALSMIEHCQRDIDLVDQAYKGDIPTLPHMRNKLAIAQSFFASASLLFEALYAGKTLDTQMMATILKDEK